MLRVCLPRVIIFHSSATAHMWQQAQFWLALNCRPGSRPMKYFDMASSITLKCAAGYTDCKIQYTIWKLWTITVHLHLSPLQHKNCTFQTSICTIKWFEQSFWYTNCTLHYDFSGRYNIFTNSTFHYIRCISQYTFCMFHYKKCTWSTIHQLFFKWSPGANALVSFYGLVSP